MCDAFESAVRGGAAPGFSAYLSRVGPGERDGLLAELTPLAVELLESRGEADPASAVLAANA
ncbi:MAG: hypothetical protein AAF790_13970, partial [Planctomycetota bacterium]